jgi:phosphate acetyltransferase
MKLSASPTRPATLSGQKPLRIIFPEAADERILKTARYLVDHKLARVELIGGPVTMRQFADSLRVSVAGISIRQPLHDPDFERYARRLYERRKASGLTLPQARELMRLPLYYGFTALREGKADICLAGNLSGPDGVARAVNDILNPAGESGALAGFFLMHSIRNQRIFGFADCVVPVRPTPQQLADTAILTADNFQRLTGEKPVVAMLSFSTKGSAIHEWVDNVKTALAFCRQKRPDLAIDGELQFDAALVPEVGQKKAPQSPVAGKANVFIFPSRNAGNIGLHIARHIGGLQIAGAYLQGLDKLLTVLPCGGAIDEFIRIAQQAAQPE